MIKIPAIAAGIFILCSYICFKYLIPLLIIKIEFFIGLLILLFHIERFVN